MKLLLDEHLSPDIAKALRRQGHDVVAVKERGEWLGLGDDQVLAVAAEQHRALVTNNLRDFRPRAAALVTSGRGHWGMVFVPGRYRRRRADTGRIVAALVAVLEAHPGEAALRSGETWLR